MPTMAPTLEEFIVAIVSSCSIVLWPGAPFQNAETCQSHNQDNAAELAAPFDHNRLS